MKKPLSPTGGMTLAEVLAVCSIIAVLTAIVTPALVQAKRRSSDGVSISNLRQCGIALLMYSDEYGGIRSMPTRPAADEVLRQMPTCDRRDYFRTGCTSPSPHPMIGSYAYVRDQWVFPDEFSWNFNVGIYEKSSGWQPALLVNLFSSSRRHAPNEWFGEYLGNPCPDQVQRLYLDGSVGLYHPHSPPGIGYTWQTLFIQN